MEITEEKVRQIVSEAQRQLGPEASAEMVRKVAREVVRRLRSEERETSEQARILCVVVIHPHAPDSAAFDRLLEGTGASVIRRAETSYAGVSVEVGLLRVPVSARGFKAMLRQRLPGGWHALVHPLESIG